MSEFEPAPSPAAAPMGRSKARAALIRRLADVVCLPESRVNAFERSMVADLLVQLLKEGEPQERARVAQRLATLAEVPFALTRLLLNDEFEVARALLEDCPSLSEAELVEAARRGGLDHRRAVASRRGVGELLSEALIERLEPEVVEPLLKNLNARISPAGIEACVIASRQHPRYVHGLMRRPELRPAGAYAMFWWADTEARRAILQRFAVGREVLQEAVGDVIPLMAAEGWSDPLARRAMQFIERRQRNRAAVKVSRFGSLEGAVEATERLGLDRDMVREIAMLSGLKASTAAKVLSDRGGEPMAVMFKATGLPKSALRLLWRVMRRPETGADGELHPALEQVLVIYDMIAVDKAQTVLRYWNWALSSALSPEVAQAVRERDAQALASLSGVERAALMALKDDLSGG